MASSDSELVERAREEYGTYYLAINSDYEYVAYQQRLIVPALEAVENGDNDRLMVLMAPGHSKTRLVTAGFAPWVLGRRPDREILIVSYGDKPAAEFGQTIRDQLESDIHHAIFPWCKIKHDSRARGYFQTTLGGKIYAVGWGGAIARIRADFVFIDDPLKNYEEAISPSIMEARMRTLNSVVKDRLKPGGKIVLCTNRWAPRDVVGQILENEGRQWKVVTVQSEPEPGSPQAKYLAPGMTYLWQEHYGKQRYEDKKRNLWAWQTTEQQMPEMAVPQRFELEWLRYYKDKVNPGRFHTCMVVDPALSKSKHADRSSIMVLAGGPMTTMRSRVNEDGQDVIRDDSPEIGQVLLVDWVLDRLNPDERTSAILRLADKWDCDFILYEEVGLSSDTFYLDREMEIYGLNCPLIPVGRAGRKGLNGGRMSKDQRIIMLINDFREGRIVLPDRLLYKQRDGIVVDLVDYLVKQEYLPWAGENSIAHDEGLDCLSRIHDPEFGSLEFEEAPPPEEKEADEKRRERGQFADRVTGGSAGWFSRF